MRRLLLISLSICVLALGGGASNEKDATATVQRLFDAMATHNAAAARAVFMPGAELVAVRTYGEISKSTGEEFVSHVGAAKDDWLERMWNPKVLIRSGLAVVWADYDFHLNGRFSHCGVDSVTLVKTSGEWKISGIAYTTEKSGCGPSPLGPPKK